MTHSSPFFPTWKVVYFENILQIFSFSWKLSTSFARISTLQTSDFSKLKQRIETWILTKASLGFLFYFFNSLCRRKKLVFSFTKDCQRSVNEKLSHQVLLRLSNLSLKGIWNSERSFKTKRHRNSFGIFFLSRNESCCDKLRNIKLTDDAHKKREVEEIKVFLESFSSPSAVYISDH